MMPAHFWRIFCFVLLIVLLASQIAMTAAHFAMAVEIRKLHCENELSHGPVNHVSAYCLKGN